MPAIKRPTAAPRPSAGATITPRDRSGELPTWTLPGVPRTTADVVALAKEYAAQHSGVCADDRHLGKFAYVAIMGAYPALKRAEIPERLRGIDRYAHAWPLRRGRT